MGNQLADKVVLVTGAARGIGVASAQRIADAGATVIISDVLTELGQEAAARITQGGGKAVFIGADISNEGDVAGLIDEIVSTYGRIDGAFNNAAVLQKGKLLHELSTAEWQRAVDVDLTGVFFCMKYEIMAMLKTGGGSIINTASSLSQVAVPGASEYVATKHGVLGITRAGAADYGKQGIRVNAILPGIIKSFVEENLDDYTKALLADVKKRHPIGRFGEPDEIGDAAVWLLSGASSFVTGAAIAVDGGYLAT